MSRVGKRQLQLLSALGGIDLYVVVPDALTRSLQRRGLLAPASERSDGFLGITPAGYRVIADALEHGQIVRRPLQARKGTAP